MIAAHEARVSAAQEAAAAKEATVLERNGTISELESKLTELQSKTASLECAIGQHYVSDLQFVTCLLGLRLHPTVLVLWQTMCWHPCHFY